MNFIVAMTGASGAPYALALIKELLEQDHTVNLIVTEAAWRVLKEEHDWDVTKREKNFFDLYSSCSKNLIYHSIKNIGANIASGSYRCDAMVIVPCSMGTLSRIAAGTSSNLVERAADVMLKEQRKLVIVPRESPLSSIHLENMLKLSRYGVPIVPAMPAFYTKPKSIQDTVNFVSGKILDLLQVEHSLFKRWGVKS